MRIYIGRYLNFWGPYQIADVLQYAGVSKDKCHAIGGWMADNVPGLVRTCEWIESKRHRKQKIHIDYYDVWSMDNTLALIVAPMLRLLKENKHGAPHTDDIDVPDYLKESFRLSPKENEWDVDDRHFARWEYILDEMIFAFEALEKGDWEMQFHTGIVDIDWKPIDADGKPVTEKDATYFEMGRGPKDTSKFDKEGYEAFYMRMKNGFRLFGKYYMTLWD